MSTLSGGGGSAEFEKLIQLATFVQGPGYLDRVKELQALEASSKEALEIATTAIARAEAAQKAFDQREAAIKQKEAALAAAQQAHDKRVAGLNAALSAAR